MEKEGWSIIYTLKAGEEAKRAAVYSVESKRALVCFIMQEKGDFNFWNYPERIKGMRESATAKDHWYYDDGDRVVAAYPA